MRVDHTLPITVGFLTVLGTLMLGISSQNVLLPALALIVAVSAHYLTDRKRWLELNTSVSNLAGMVVVLVAAWEYYGRFEEESRLLALTNLLVYLQFVELYRMKTARIYWHLMMLSFLQVAVAAALNISAVFAPLLLLYLGTSVVVLVLFYLQRESRAASVARAGTALASSAPYSSPGGLSVVAPTTPPAAVPAASRFALLSTPSTFSGPDYNGRLQEASGRMLRRPLVVMMVLSLVVGAVVFCLTPRIRRSPALRFVQTPEHVVGFTERVTLGEVGEISENPESVMRVRFLDAAGKPFQLAGELRLRGTVLTHYAGGSWGKGRQSDRLPQQLTPPVGRDRVMQEVTIEKFRSPLLFAVYPVTIDGTNPLVADLSRRQLVYSERDKPERFTYKLATYALRNRRIADLSPVQTDFGRPLEAQLWQQPKDDPRTPDPENLTELPRIANEQVVGLPPADVIGRANRVNEYLRDSGRFGYTLTAPRRQTNIDPIEDFVTNNPEGHCEYFASALALMLRSVGVPSRMVVGYRGGEWNTVGEYYQIRQLHAHAWVEVYLRPNQLPDAVRGREGWLAGGWLALDPTPSGLDTLNLEEIGLWDRIKHLADYGQLMWSNYVLEMDMHRQRRDIYRPIRDAMDEYTGGMFEEPSWRNRFPNLGEWFRGWLGRDWFAWVRGAMFVLVAALLAGGVWVAVRLMLLLVHRRKAAKQGVARSEVDFYQRFEDLLARYELKRSRGQTQREFAMAASGQLAEGAPGGATAELPRCVVDAFYRVRFGGRHLDTSEREAVEHALSELEAALSDDQ